MGDGVNSPAGGSRPVLLVVWGGAAPGRRLGGRGGTSDHRASPCTGLAGG